MLLQTDKHLGLFGFFVCKWILQVAPLVGAWVISRAGFLSFVNAGGARIVFTFTFSADFLCAETFTNPSVLTRTLYHRLRNPRWQCVQNRYGCCLVEVGDFIGPRCSGEFTGEAPLEISLVEVFSQRH